MADGQKNLKPFDQRTEDEQREIRKKGGIKSGESRRRKKALRTALKEAISLSLKDLHPDLKNGIMRAARIRDDGLTIGDAVLGSIVRSACAGDPKMMKILLDTIGESADVRLREREVKLKEKSLDDDRADGAASITFVFEREETE
nr:MAG TPA: hypothetical protein [Caudoviricetes sp.]